MIAKLIFLSKILSKNVVVNPMEPFQLHLCFVTLLYIMVVVVPKIKIVPFGKQHSLVSRNDGMIHIARKMLVLSNSLTLFS